MMVMPGVVAFHMPVSQTSASAGSDSSALLAARKSGSDGEPVSSSPSNRKVTLHGSPPLASKARQASTKVMSWPLSSEAPRATISCRPFALLQARREGIGLPELQRIGRLHVVMAVEQHMRRVLALGVRMADHDRMARESAAIRRCSRVPGVPSRASRRRARTPWCRPGRSRPKVCAINQTAFAWRRRYSCRWWRERRRAWP